MKNDPMKVKYAEGGSLLNPIEREQYSIGGAVAKALSETFENYTKKETKNKMKSVHDAVEKAVSERDTTKMKKTDIFNMVANDQDVTVQDVKNIEKVFAYQAGGGGKENLLGEIVQGIRAVAKKPTELQKIAEDFGGGKLTKEARKKTGKAVLATGSIGVAASGATGVGGYFAGLSDAQESEIKENKTSTVDNITSGTMASAFSKASKNPTKYVFVKKGQPYFKYKGEDIPFALATEEKDIVLDMTPRSKNSEGGSALRNQRSSLYEDQQKKMKEEIERLSRVRLEAENIEPTSENIELMRIQIQEEQMDEDMQRGYSRRGKSAGGKIISLLLKKNAKELPKKTKKAKESLLSQAKQDEKAAGMSKEELDEMSDEDYLDFVESMSPSSATRMDEPLEDVYEIIQQMEPEEVAKNMQLFRSVEDIQEYIENLNPNEARSFRDNLSEEDAKDFKEFLNLPELGPRVIKNQGGDPLLVPVEGMPVDTYPNIPEDEIEGVLASQKPDEEMEEDYVSYVMEQTLSPEETEYVNSVLATDDRLSVLFDKLILASSEFSGEGKVEGPGDGTSDDIPARLSDGEFVFTKKAVDQLGTDNLQILMDDAERAYDGGLMKKSENDFSKLDDDIHKVMLSANRSPSIR